MQEKEIKVVLGAMYGDEGKGVTTQWLCDNAIRSGKKPVVVRFSGGPQAGHTVVNGSKEHICSSFGSGVLLGVQTTYLSTALVDPICICNEVDALTKKGVVVPPLCPTLARVITPYDVMANQKDEKNLSDGTCGRGIWKAWQRCRQFDEEGKMHNFWNVLEDPRTYLTHVRAYYKIGEDERNHELEMLFIHAVDRIKNASWFTKDEGLLQADVIIFEGSQGLLLDAKRGFKPHVTGTEVGLAPIKDWLTKDTEVYLVYRTYLTRHGADDILSMEPLPTHWRLPSDETNVTNEYQGEFKTGIMDFDLANRAIDRHLLDRYDVKYNLVITHMDCINDENTRFSWPYISHRLLCKSNLGDADSHLARRLVTHTFWKSLNLSFDKIYTCTDRCGIFQNQRF